MIFGVRGVQVGSKNRSKNEVNKGRHLGIDFYFHHGPSGRHLGFIWSHLGPYWLHLGSILAPSWLHLGSILAPSWLHLGSILAPSWLHLDHLGPSWTILAPSLAILAPEQKVELKNRRITKAPLCICDPLMILMIPKIHPPCLRRFSAILGAIFALPSSTSSQK